VATAADALRARMHTMERDIVQLLHDLGLDAGRLAQELQGLHAESAALRPAVEHAPPASAAAESEAVAPAAADSPPAATPPAAPEPADAGAERNEGAGDEEAARIVALDMALSGSSRAEVDRHLADNYRVADRGALLDDVFAAIE
jgi:hypothetical protein